MAFGDQKFVGARQLVRASGSLAAVAHCKTGRRTLRPGARTCERIQLIDPRARTFDLFRYLIICALLQKWRCKIGYIRSEHYIE
jgi:hypothetical protein